MLRKGKIILAVVISLTALSCDSDIDREAVLEWVESFENGMHSQTQYNDLLFDLRYQPSLARTIINYPDADDKTIDKISVADSSLLYFVLKITSTDHTKNVAESLSIAESQLEQMIHYFSFELQKQIFLEQEGKTQSPVLYHFEKSYGLRKEETIVMAFEASEIRSGWINLFIESSVFGEEKIVLKIKKGTLTQFRV